MGVDRFLECFGAMTESFYEESAPALDLREFVACNWVRVVRLAGASKRTPIIPDGCADIMLNDDAPPFVAGPDATTRWIAEREGTVIVGIRFRPGAARAILGCPAGLILNGGALLSDLAPAGSVHALHQSLLSTTNLHERHALLEDWVRNALSRSATRASDRAVVAACRMLTLEPGVGIDALARKLDWNGRRIHRQFQSACGYGPKHFQRIMRVQKAIRVAHTVSAPRLVAVAQAAGYADQAHMTRDFRDITGFTPAGYLAIAAPEVGTWIGEGW